MNLAPADWVVLVAYLVAMAGIGLYVGRKVKDTEHYFLGKRKFSKWLMIGQSFGQGTHAEMPVSLVGAFMFFPLLGFSINVLSLLGLVLAIGIVVDDAIVVVEAVMHNIEHGMEPRAATAPISTSQSPTALSR